MPFHSSPPLLEHIGALVTGRVIAKKKLNITNTSNWMVLVEWRVFWGVLLELAWAAVGACSVLIRCFLGPSSHRLVALRV